MTTRARFTAVAGAAFAGIGFGPRASRAAEFAYKMGHDMPADHPLNVRAVEAAGRVAKTTNGRVEIKLFPNSQLGGDPSMFEQLRSGAVEMLAMPGAFITTVPLASRSRRTLPLRFRIARRRAKAMDGNPGRGVVRDAIKANGIWVLDKIWENGFRDITTSTKPIKTVDDLAGFKIRVSPGKIRVDTFQSLGASPSPISANEVYTALQTKIVDGQENPLVTIETMRFYEVQKYCSLSQHMWSGYWTLAYPPAWKKLPADLQAIVAKEFNAAAVVERRDLVLLQSSIQDKLHRQGLAFNPVDVATFKRKLAANGYYGRWKAEFGAPAWTALEQYAGKL